MNQTLRHTLEGHTAAPDQLDWSQIHETLAMLALAVAQIDTSLVEGNNSINSLTASFTRMADHTQLIIDRVTALDAGVGSEIADSARIIQSEVMSAIVAFQFYDRLTQRMEHVGDSLERTGHLISNPEERCKIILKVITPWRQSALCLNTLWPGTPLLKHYKFIIITLMQK